MSSPAHLLLLKLASGGLMLNSDNDTTTTTVSPASTTSPTINNNTVDRHHFWTVTAKDEDSRTRAILTIIAGSLTFTVCAITAATYFRMRKNSQIFNSLNHFFAMSFCLACVSAVNYITAAAVRLWSTDPGLLQGFCDVSAVHVLLSTYPMLLCELGYFIAAFRRLRTAQAITGGSSSSVPVEGDDDDNHHHRQDASYGTLDENSAGFFRTDNNHHRQQQQIPQDEEKLDQAMLIVDSGEVFFRRFSGATLAICLVIGMALNAALPLQSQWGTRFDPTTQSWCWIPATDDDGNGNKREGLYIAIQMLVEVVPLIGTPIMGIVSLVQLYKSLGSFPRSAIARVVYILVFVLTFTVGIIIRLRFSAEGGGKFMAFAEPSIGFMNAVTFFVSEIYPVWLQSRPRYLSDMQRLESTGTITTVASSSSAAAGGGDGDHDDGTQQLIMSTTTTREIIEPSLAVAIEAGAFIQGAVAASSRRQTIIADESSMSRSPSRVGGGGDHNNNNNNNNNPETAADHARRITRKIQEYAEHQRAASTNFLVMTFCFLNGFIDVWSFVSFGVFCGSSVAGNVGVTSLAVAYSNWFPDVYADKYIHPLHHIVLSLLSIFLPVLVATVSAKLIVRFNSTIGHSASMGLLGFGCVILFATWICSLSFFSYKWFDRSQRVPQARYLAVGGLSLFAGCQLAYHRIFLPLFRLPTEPWVTSSVLDIVAQRWLTEDSILILNAACEERFPSAMRRWVQFVASIAYGVGASAALISGTYETGGTFAIAPIIGIFMLLLSLDWQVLDDTVHLSLESAHSMRTGGGGLVLGDGDGDDDDDGGGRGRGGRGGGGHDGGDGDDDDDGVVGHRGRRRGERAGSTISMQQTTAINSEASVNDSAVTQRSLYH